MDWNDRFLEHDRAITLSCGRATAPTIYCRLLQTLNGDVPIEDYDVSVGDADELPVALDMSTYDWPKLVEYVGKISNSELELGVTTGWKSPMGFGTALTAVFCGSKFEVLDEADIETIGEIVLPFTIDQISHTLANGRRGLGDVDWPQRGCFCRDLFLELVGVSSLARSAELPNHAWMHSQYNPGPPVVHSSVYHRDIREFVYDVVRSFVVHATPSRMKNTIDVGDELWNMLGRCSHMPSKDSELVDYATEVDPYDTVPPLLHSLTAKTLFPLRELSIDYVRKGLVEAAEAESGSLWIDLGDKGGVLTVPPYTCLASTYQRLINRVAV